MTFTCRLHKHAGDYSVRVTQYHINDVRKYLEEGGKPMSCETVREKCNGYKAPDITCRQHEPPPEPRNTKPEVKLEVKPETKAETKPAETKPVEEKRGTATNTGKPVQTRLSRFVEEEEKVEAKPNEESKQLVEPNREYGVGITVLNLLLDDLARELRVPTTIVEPLLNWVLSYLSKYWSVGFDRLVIDLLNSSNEDVQFSLEVLGIEVRERKITDDGFARLRMVVSSIIKHLEKAGIIEYVRDLGVVNLVRAGH